jgi:hypothetical protein
MKLLDSKSNGNWRGCRKTLLVESGEEAKVREAGGC